MYNKNIKYFLSGDAVLKWLETPSVYLIKKDDLYELDNDSFEFLKNCASATGCATRSILIGDISVQEGYGKADIIHASWIKRNIYGQWQDT